MELDLYPRSPFINYDEESDVEFNILNWWHEQKLTYPMLSMLTQDLITVHVSTTSSESNFSLPEEYLMSEEHVSHMIW